MSGAPGPTTLTAAVRSAAEAEAQRLLAEIDGVAGVVVATADGFDIASAARGGLDARRIAAMASSISALGDVVSAETSLGRGTSVTVNTDRGFAVAHGVPRADIGLVIFLLAGPDALLGNVNFRAAEAARRLANT